MAYDKNGLDLVKVANTDQVKLFTYSSSDSLETIFASSYFNVDSTDDSDTGQLLAANDFIFIGSSDGTSIATVASVNPIVISASAEEGVGSLEVLVGSGQQYTTVKGAVDAGYTRIGVISDVAESASITLTGTEYYIELFATWDLASYTVTGASVVSIDITGDKNGELKYTATGDQDLFSGASLSYLCVSNIKINNSTPATQTAPFPARNTYTFKFIADSISYLHSPTSDNAPLLIQNVGSIATNVVLLGNVSQHGRCLLVGSGGSINGFSYNGTPKYNDSSRQFIIVDDGLVCNGTINAAGSASEQYYVGMSNGGQIDNLVFTRDDNAKTHLILNIGNPQINNVYGNTGDILDDGFTSARICNMRNFGDGTSVTYVSNQISFTSCQFNSTVNVEGNDSTFLGCRVGAVAGGGSHTIDVKAGANRSSIVGCRTDAALIDAGTGTVTAGNQVY